MPHYSVKTVYEKIIGPKPVIHWDNMVWNWLNIPKNRFICWLEVQGRLQTTANLARFGVSNTANCLICGQADEDHKHLFFACPYSSRCISALKLWLGISYSTSNLKQLMRFIAHGRMSKFRKQVSFAMLAAAVYAVWSSRNSCFWNASFPTVQNMVARVKKNVRDRILFVLPKNVTRRDSLWFATLLVGAVASVFVAVGLLCMLLQLGSMVAKISTPMEGSGHLGLSDSTMVNEMQGGSTRG
ncbi:uncharacterized protein [Spinacia oleracea]|uniref:Reverse transcriptase zinc-binding domain-containing protein n=1 Tax=Spinacia oleracea TaxID=3562 RepID=A0A9R0IM47_SPIOL|nr:uncharacterized protein LOC110791133 [Spinacia oleracea]